MSNNNQLKNKNKNTNRLKNKNAYSSANLVAQNSDLFTNNSKQFHVPKRLGIRFKTILIAIAISVIPASLLSITTYLITKRSANSEIVLAQKQLTQIQLSRTQRLAAQFSQFLQARFREIETLAKNPTFIDPNLWSRATQAEKKAILTSFQTETQLYHEITFLDLQGNPLFQSQSSRHLETNYSDREYFQAAIVSKKIIINRSESEANNKKSGIEYIVPIINAWTGKVNGVIYLFLREREITEIFTEYTNSSHQWYLIDSEGIFFAGSNAEYINSKAQEFFPDIDNLYRARKQSTGIYSNQLENNQQLLSYVPIKTQGLYPDQYLGAVITTEIFPTLIDLENGSWILLTGVIITALIISLIAAYIANTMTIPILNSIKAVELISQGKLDTRIPIKGKDELAMLSNKINQMAEKLMYLIERQTILAKTSELMARIARARNVQQLQSPFNHFLTEVRSLIKSDRLIFYQFDQNWSGTIIAESVAKGFPKSLGAEINDPCFAENYIEKYRRGRIQATRNIYEAGLTECHLKQLEAFAVKSNLVIPVVVKTEVELEKDELIGLLIAHQCSSARIWNNFEIDYLKEVANQLGLALRGYSICEQVIEKQENFQDKINYFINKNQQLSYGDLAVQPTASSRELDDFTKFFIKTIEGIAQLIVPIKNNTQTVRKYLEKNSNDINELNQQIVEQTSKIEQLIAAIEPIANYVQIVYKNINQISKISHGSITQVKTEKNNLNYVFESIIKLQKTVVKSIGKIKDIEQSSIEVVGNIPILKKITLETELLTKELNKKDIAAIESVNQKMQKMAIQLVSVISEIETLGENIQRQTSEMVREMEINSAQTSGVVPIAEDANKNIAKIFKTSVEIDHLLKLTNSSTTSQISTLQKITTLTSKLTQLSERSSYQSQQVKNSVEITEVAMGNLQKSVDVFKVKE